MADMTFNGVDMSKYFRIIDIIRPIGNKRTITTDNAPLLGVNIQAVRRGEKEHTIKFAMKTANDPQKMEELKHELAGVLNVLEPVKITYSDEPDKYYLGLPVDEVTPSNITRWFLHSELTLLIPDGVAHSKTYKTLDSGTDAQVSADKITFTIQNNGTETAYPRITVRNNAENGYIGLVNSKGAFEVGDREEKDKQLVHQSQFLLDYKDGNLLRGFNAAQKNVAISNYRPYSYGGNLATFSYWGRNHIGLALNNPNHTPASLTWTIPADSNGQIGSLYDYIWWRQIFWAGTINQLGGMKLLVSDTNGKFLYGVETWKRSYGTESEYAVIASDGKDWYNILRKWNFQATHLANENPFTPEAGFMDIRRVDEYLQLSWWGQEVVIKVPEIQGRKSAKIHVTFEAVADRPMMSHMHLDGLYYRKDFVRVREDIPNRFPMGSSVVINSEDDTVSVDGLLKVSEVVDGSKWLSFPPGRSTLEIYQSSFVRQSPHVKIEFEERWL